MHPLQNTCTHTHSTYAHTQKTLCFHTYYTTHMLSLLKCAVTLTKASQPARHCRRCLPPLSLQRPVDGACFFSLFFLRGVDKHTNTNLYAAAPKKSRLHGAFQKVKGSDHVQKRRSFYSSVVSLNLALSSFLDANARAHKATEREREREPAKAASAAKERGRASDRALYSPRPHSPLALPTKPPPSLSLSLSCAHTGGARRPSAWLSRR